MDNATADLIETALTEMLDLHGTTVETCEPWHFTVSLKATDLRKICKGLGIAYDHKQQAAHEVIAKLRNWK